MVNRLKPLNVMDFTGGINLRPETFQLADNELPVLLNLEVDPRGGINTRKSWRYANPNAVTAGTWDPRNAFMHRKADNTQWTYVVNDHTLYAAGIGGAWTNAIAGCDAIPHQADFAAWDDLVYATRGGSSPSVYLNALVATALTACAAANWQNDYTAPGATDTFPIASLVAQHAGYMFTAVTREDGTAHPTRLRWSHPNNPRRWAKDDYIDLSEGGQRITAIIPFMDRLLVFKPDSVWALFGYSSETWELTNISRTIGCLNQQTVCRSESAVFFLSWPQGVFAYDAQTATELSVQIRTLFEDNKMDPAALTNSWLGWVGRRLWVSLPYDGDAPAPDDAKTAFVWDPVLSSWTMFQGGDTCVPGPYIERIELQSESSQVTFVRTRPHTVALNADDEVAVDECQPDHPHPFPTRIRTRWLDAGAPTWRKSWRRPDFLLRGITLDTYVNVQVFHDYDAFNAQRSYVVAYTPDPIGMLYTVDGDPEDRGFLWGDGTLYGGSDQSSSVERGSTMGRAGTVQLSMEGNPGAAWGLNGIIFKYVPRRFR